MLLQFSVKNYLSYRDEKILSLVPSSDKELVSNIKTRGKYKALDVITIYGANASGKTALFKAMTVALNIIRNSTKMQINEAIPVIPFFLDEESRNKPTSFEFQFVAEDDKKYIYGFSAFPDRVTEEYLYCYNTNRPTKVFDRKNGQYTYSRSYVNELKKYEEMNTPNKLFLATATNWNSEITKYAYKWLSEGIDTNTDFQNFEQFSLAKYREEADQGKNEYLKFALEMLKNADINISDINFKYRDLSNNAELMGQFPQIVINNQKQKAQLIQYEISAVHSVINEKGKKKNYSLPMSEESMGTRLIFMFAPFIKDTFDKSKVFVIDEIDKSLHPLLVKSLFQLFSSERSNGSQLIATTHDTSQMSLRRLRRDQIYLTEKNQENGVSDLYSLDDFERPVRKNENIEKGYLLGRYGAIPIITAEDII